jgi:hypothetical protein
MARGMIASLATVGFGRLVRGIHQIGTAAEETESKVRGSLLTPATKWPQVSMNQMPGPARYDGCLAGTKEEGPGRHRNRFAGLYVTEGTFGTK